MTITAPADGASIWRTVSVSASVTDNVGISGVKLKIDGSERGSAFTEVPVSVYTTTLDTTTLLNGSHAFEVCASDVAGNSACSGVVHVSVTNVTNCEAPFVPNQEANACVCPADTHWDGTSCAPGPSPDTTPPTVRFTWPFDEALMGGTADVVAAIADDVSVATVTLQVDGALVENSFTEGPAGVYTTTLETTRLTNDLHYLTISATDPSGNSSSARVFVIVSNVSCIPPFVSNGTACVCPAGQHQEGNTCVPDSFSIQGTVTGPIGPGIAVTFSGGIAPVTTTTDSSGAYRFTGVSNGSYTIAVAAAGYSFSPASRQVDVTGTTVAGQDFIATAPVLIGTAAVLVDERLYRLLQAELDSYRSKAQARRGFTIDLVPVYEIDDLPHARVREYVKALKDLNPALEGVLFVGNIKLPSFFQSRADNLDVRLLPRYYEDLDGVFRKDLADGSTIPACPASPDHCYTGGTATVGRHDLDYTAKGPLPGPEIWASFMPVGVTGTPNGYDDFAAQLRPYLQKVSRYYDGQTTANGRFYYVSNDIGERMDQNWDTFGKGSIDFYGKAGPAGETGTACIQNGVNLCYVRWPTETYATYAELHAAWAVSNPGEGWQQDSVFLNHMAGTVYSVVEVNVHSNWIWSLVESAQARAITNGGLLVALDGCGVAAMSQPGSPSSTDVDGWLASDNIMLAFLYGSSQVVAGLGDSFTRGHYANHPTVWSRMKVAGDYLGKAHFERMKVNYQAATNASELREQGAEMLVGDPFVDWR